MMTPHQSNLVEFIPKESDLTLSKLGYNGMITVTSSTARKLWYLLANEIKELAIKGGMIEVSLRIL